MTPLLAGLALQRCPCSLPCQTPAMNTSWYRTEVWEPLEDFPRALCSSLGLYLPSHQQENISSQCWLQPHPPSCPGWIQVQGGRDGLYPSLSSCTAKGVIDKQVSALEEKCRSIFEAASVINTEPWLSLLLTGFQMMAGGVIRALGSTVSEIITG